MHASPAPLSTWARNVAPSPTLAVDAKAKALQAAALPAAPCRRRPAGGGP